MSSDENATAPAANDGGDQSNQVLLIVSWLWVGVPFLYGVYSLLTTASKLFAH